MRQVLTLAAAAAVAALLAAPPAGAGTAKKGPTLKGLAAQIKSLQKQVTTLKKRAAADEDVISATLAYTVCSTAVTADVIQDTFAGIDSHVTAPGLPYFGAQTAVNDYQACSGFQIVRAHNQSPPNTNVMRALLDIFKPRSFAGHQNGVDLTRQLGHSFGQFLVLSSQLRIRFQ
jgi:gas vesicle protein